MTDPRNATPAVAPNEAGRVAGRRVILVGFLAVALVTAFVIVRILQTTEPGPDPDQIPKRPEARSP